VLRGESGWLVVNYEKYREFRTERQERHRRYMAERRASRESGDSHVNDGGTEAEAEAEAEADRSTRSDPDEVSEIWDAMNALRTEAIPGSRRLPLTKDRRRAVRARLKDGYTREDCLAVVQHFADRARKHPDQAQWFNGSTPWRPENFARALDQQAPQADKSRGHARLDGTETYAGGEVEI
jgi:hypothetical protein